MKEIDIRGILSSFGKLSKQWGLGESVGRVWGFLLFSSTPVTQREIGKGTGYSRGLVSRSLRKLEELDMLVISKKGKEFYYTTNASLIKGFNKVIKNFLEKEVKPIIEHLSTNLNKIEDTNIKENVMRVIKEYKRLSAGIMICSKTMETLSSLNQNISNIPIFPKK